MFGCGSDIDSSVDSLSVWILGVHMAKGFLANFELSLSYLVGFIHGFDCGFLQNEKIKFLNQKTSCLGAVFVELYYLVKSPVSLLVEKAWIKRVQGFIIRLPRDCVCSWWWYYSR
ncbi:hypothetical protein L2E82_40776 [Cichorium intybus]|uniref:Uncharacterized protein n=1 Tax=Cichorium intybus TaxID=13427 RepID=A0ACB9ALY2_CICIN|nr:hypothetical protein L2E82_40776 [Cichorium intybus]